MWLLWVNIDFFFELTSKKDILMYVSGSKFCFIYGRNFSGAFHDLKILSLQVNVVTTLRRYSRYSLALLFISFS